MSLFDGVKSQCIDSNGKCRVLNYDNLSLATLLPPLDVEEVDVDTRNVKLADIKTAMKFIKDRNLEITEQNGVEEIGIIQGLWIKSKENPQIILFGYIPLEFDDNKNALKDVPFSDPDITDPIFSGDESHLMSMEHNAKVAEYLKQYSIFMWAKDTENFGKKNFVIDKNYVYHIGLEDYMFPKNQNNNFIRDDKIIVPDKETRDRLISFVDISSLNDSTLEEQYKHKSHIDGSVLFKTVNDFRYERRQLVFVGRKSVLSWKNSKISEEERYVVHTQLSPNSQNPYYYRNNFISNGKLAIIQNTHYKDFPSALAVSSKWEQYGINVGYSPIPGSIYVPENPSFNVYTEKGLVHKSEKEPEKDSHRLNILNYNDGTYAALLFLC